MILNESGVVFDPVAHTYTLDGKELSGITGRIHERLFPDMFAGVNSEILAKAASIGTIIHSNCEEYDNELPITETYLSDSRMSIEDIERIQESLTSYMAIKKDNNLNHMRSEYIVTDRQTFASGIDKVYYVDENTVDIADIKTTYDLDKDYVMWQLSTYKYLFEKQNPHIKVRRCYAVWLRGCKYKLVELSPVDGVFVERMLYTEEPIELRPISDDKSLAIRNQFGESIALFKVQYDAAKAWDETKKSIKQAMKLAGINHIEIDGMKVDLTDPSVSKVFDSKRYEKEHKELIGDYMTDKTTDSRLLIKFT